MTIDIDQFMAVWYPNQSRAVYDAMRRDLQTLIAQERVACIEAINSAAFNSDLFSVDENYAGYARGIRDAVNAIRARTT